MEDDTLVIDFTIHMKLGGPVDTEYLVIMFRHQNGTGSDFAEWYEKHPVTITGVFTNGTYLAYVITDTCDQLDQASTNGGLVFFNASVSPAVQAAEVTPSSGNIPEPTTATLSLLALAGLAARRRRV